VDNDPGFCRTKPIAEYNTVLIDFLMNLQVGRHAPLVCNKPATLQSGFCLDLLKAGVYYLKFPDY
jgi:hypothetical protein